MTARKVLEVVDELEFRYPEDDSTRYTVPAGLTLHAGEAWCVRGVSGSGKSTLMTLLAALRRFSRGRIEYGFRGSATEVVSSRRWRPTVGPALWRRIGFAFQKPELIRALDVGDNLSLVAQNGVEHSLFDPEEWDRISRSRVWEISGGQIQRLGLMRAFGADQDLVFLDEPTNNLDRRNRAAVADYVARRRGGRGLVVVSHDDEFMASLETDRVLEVRERPAAGGGLDRALVETERAEKVQSASRPPHDHHPSPTTADREITNDQEVASDV